jgi:uncharacterized protein DUF1801
MTSNKAAPGPSLAEHLKKIPPAVRPTVQATRRTIKAVAPSVTEVSYRSEPPRSNRALWKIVRYDVDGENVAGIGVFPTYASLFFYRGRELDDGSGLLEGGGKDMRFIRLRSPADAQSPATKRMVRRAFTLR